MWQNVEPILTKMLDYKDFSCDYLPTYLPTNLGNELKVGLMRSLCSMLNGNSVANLINILRAQITTLES